MDIFAHLNTLVYKNSSLKYENLSEEDKKTWNGYLLTWWISHNYELVDLCEYASGRFSQFTDQQLFNFLNDIVPYGERINIATKIKKDESFELIPKILKLTDMKPKDALVLISLLDDEQKTELKKLKI